MKNEVAEGPAFSKEFEKLMQRIENRDTTKQMSDEDLKDLKRAIDDEMIRRGVVRHICFIVTGKQIGRAHV